MATALCPICQEDPKNPRLLPCIHSFCLKCLGDYCRDKLPGDYVPCPVCRSEFQIPKNGAAGLPVRTHAEEPLKVAQLDEERYCEKHEDERIKVYCFDCNVDVCAMCCLQYHKTHQFEEIVEQFFRSINEEIEQVTSRIECFRGLSAQIEATNNKTLHNIQSMEVEVQKRSEEIRQLVDRQESELLQELQSLKSAAEEEAKSQTDALQLAVSEMESFRTSSLELRSKGSPSDVTQAANEVHERAKELLETYIIPSEYHAPSYKFTPVNVDELLRDDQNFIGHVIEVVDSGNVKCYY